MMRFLAVKNITLLTFAIFSAFSIAGEYNAGDQFRNTAVEYEQKASIADQKGEKRKADIYRQLAEIKRHAGQLADEGRWGEISWDRYEELNAKLYTEGK